MDRFRPLVAQTKNFHDPLGVDLVEENESDALKNVRKSSAEVNLRSHSSSNKHSKYLPKKKFSLGGSFPYLQEYELICNSAESHEIFQWGLSSELAACRFRSICWRVFLKILPPSSSKWLAILRNKREEYESTRHKLMVTPDLIDEALDPSVNNPLSQNEESPWNQYFEDSELKRLIRLDVQRTFPEIEFFQLPRIQEMMVSILFCYARKYPNLSYVQGMHEVLAPLTFVLNCDHLAHSHIMEQNGTPTLLQELMDQAYLEHDSYALFEVVMERLHQWYEDTEFRSDTMPKVQMVQSQPFARPQDVGPTTKIVQRLTRIHDLLLKQKEPEIFAHLCRLEIPPQVYGIRWARLMLGREFALTDLLTVWDAIFADDSDNFILVEYLMVAMLSYIKEELLSSDYITSLNMLMRYPSGSDVETIIKLALHFRNPERSAPSYRPIAQPAQTIGGQPNIHREPQHTQKLHHPSITRSSSLPRPSSSGPSQLKHRSTSVDQRPRSSGESRTRRTSPTVEAIGSLGGFSFRKGEDASAQEETSLHGGEVLVSSRTRVVSGLVRLGERLTRPTMANGSPTELDINERPMDELSIVKRSAPIPAGRGEETDPNVTPISSSTESEDNLAYPQRNVTAGRSRRPSAEDLLAVCLGCALRLSNHQATLSTRLLQLNIESDFTVRAAMEGITEVIDTLRHVRIRQRKSTSPESKTSRDTNCDLKQCKQSQQHFSHPLMDSDDAT